MADGKVWKSLQNNFRIYTVPWRCRLENVSYDEKCIQK